MHVASLRTLHYLVVLAGLSAAVATMAQTPSPAPQKAGRPSQTGGKAGSDGSVGSADKTAPVVVPPKLVRDSRPVYPPVLAGSGQEGVVVLELEVAPDGQVRDAKVLTSAGEVFDQAALAAAKGLGFEPATSNGKPVAVKIQFRYRIREDAKPVAPVALPAEATVPVAPETPQPSLDAPPAAEVRKGARVVGRVLERGTKRPVAGALVVLPAHEMETYTENDGRFVFEGVPAGSTPIFLPGTDHQPLRTTIRVPQQGEVETVLRPELKSYVLYRASAVAPAESGEVAKRTISREEIAKVPGVYGDSFKVVTNLPGVARTGNSGSGQIVVRGSAPGDTQSVVEGVEIPALFHFGGIYSVFNTDFLDAVDFQPGNQPVRYGRRTGGLIETRLAIPKPDDGWRTVIEANLFHTGVISGGPIGKDTNIALAARRSYIDVVLDTVVPAGALPFALAPRYYDYQAKVDHRLSAKASATLFLFGSDDKFEALVDKPPAGFPDARGGVSAGTSFFGGLGVFRYADKHFRAQSTLGIVPQTLNLGVGDALKFDLTSTRVTLRQDLAYDLGPATVRGGMDWQWQPYEIAIKLPFSPSSQEPGTGDTGAPATTVEVAQKGAFYYPALWLDAVWRPTKTTEVVPGVRLDYFMSYEDLADGTTTKNRLDSTLLPRLAARQKIGAKWTVEAAAGFTSQSPDPQQLGTAVGNPNLKAIHGFEVSTGVEGQVTDAIQVELQLFDKTLSDLVSPNPNWPASGVSYENIGEGKVRGLELLVRHAPVGKFFGWVSYTLQRATRIDRPGEVERLFGWDQTHILTALGSYKLPRNWEIGARWRFSTGSPYTPVVGSTWSSDNDTWSNVSSTCVNCERLPAFHQLDIRVDKTWAFDSWVLSTYLDLQNAYNRANAEGITYSYDARQKVYQSGLPIIPSFGIRGEF
jgi:TonB family protein